MGEKRQRSIRYGSQMRQQAFCNYPYRIPAIYGTGLQELK